MKGKILVNMIIIPSIVFTIANGVTHTSFANENKTKTEYVISQSEESKFLEEIYKTEKDDLKIKALTKRYQIKIILIKK